MDNMYIYMINNKIIYKIMFAVMIQFNFAKQFSSTIQFNTKGRLVGGGRVEWGAGIGGRHNISE